MARALTPIGLFALALAVRLLPWPTVMEESRVVFFGMDAWYHMRRVRLALSNGGWPPSFDPYLNFPHGGQVIWPPLFDAFVTWIVWPLHALGGPDAAERVAALIPPLLGAACVVVLHRLALRLFDPAVALASGLLLALLSAHYWYSQIGFLDHHVAVGLAATGLLMAALRVLEAPSRARWLATGALAGGGLLLWPGMVLHVGLVEAGLLSACLARRDRAGAAEDARGLALLNGVAFAIVLPSGLSASWLVWSDFSPAVLSRFQPWFFAVVALHAELCHRAWSRRGERRGARVAHALAAGALLVAGSAVALPEIGTGLDEARRWLTTDEAFQSTVNESKPLFVAESGVDATNAELRLSRFLYLLPVALLVLVRRAWTDPRRAELLFVAFWVLSLSSVTLLQRRFFDSLSPGFALVLGWSAVELWRARPPSLRGSPPRRAVAALAAGAVLLAGLAPMLATYRLPLENLWCAATGSPMTLPKNEFSRRILLETALWLRDNTPPTAGPLDPGAAPEYGVLAFWSFGHLINYVAQRPTVVGNFGDDLGEENLRRTTAYFASREADAIRILEALRARYVLARTLGAVPPEQLAGAAMQTRLSVDDSPGLERHRLLYESFPAGEYAELGRSEYRIFERVEGARIAGRAPAGAEVRATLAYESNRGRAGVYRTRAVADEGGRYELRVPYATRGGPPGVRTAGSYRVASGSRVGEVAVDEVAVRSGGAVPGPDFDVQ